MSKELRALGNATLMFVIFLLGWSVATSGEGFRTRVSPRMLRMEIEERSPGNHTERVKVSVPFFLFKGGLHLAGSSKLRRELEFRLGDEVTSDLLQGVWADLEKAAPGEVVTRTHEETRLSFSRNGKDVVLEIREGVQEGDASGEVVTLRLPAHLFKAVVEMERDLDARALLHDLQNAERGDVVELTTDDGSVRIRID